jgi:hypothetical protein
MRPFIVILLAAFLSIAAAKMRAVGLGKCRLDCDEYDLTTLNETPQTLAALKNGHWHVLYAPKKDKFNCLQMNFGESNVQLSYKRGKKTIYIPPTGGLNLVHGTSGGSTLEADQFLIVNNSRTRLIMRKVQDLVKPQLLVRTMPTYPELVVVTMCVDLVKTLKYQTAWIMKKGTATARNDLSTAESDFLKESSEVNIWKDLKILGFVRKELAS